MVILISWRIMRLLIKNPEVPLWLKALLSNFSVLPTIFPLMKYSWFTMFRVYRKVIQIYRYRYSYRYRWASHVTVMVKNAPANTRHIRDVDSVPGSGRSHGWGHGNPLQYSCLETLMDRGGWWDMVHRIAESWVWLKQLSMHRYIYFFQILFLYRLLQYIEYSSLCYILGVVVSLFYI